MKMTWDMIPPLAKVDIGGVVYHCPEGWNPAGVTLIAPDGQRYPGSPGPEDLVDWVGSAVSDPPEMLDRFNQAQGVTEAAAMQTASAVLGARVIETGAIAQCPHCGHTIEVALTERKS